MTKINPDIKRGIYLLILGMVITAFIIVNSPDFFSSGIIYAIIGILSIAGYMIWEKI